MFAQFTPIIWTILASIITALITHILTMRKAKADASSTELENVDHVIKIWKTLAEDLTAKVPEWMKQIEELKAENEKWRLLAEGLNLKIAELTRNINQLHEENGSLKRQIQDLEKLLTKSINN